MRHFMEAEQDVPTEDISLLSHAQKTLSHLVLWTFDLQPQASTKGRTDSADNAAVVAVATI